jgi:plasmid rolling circle replication initiator protein Rep
MSFVNKTLSQISKKDKPWINHRVNNMIIQDIYDTSGIGAYVRYAQRMADCAKLLIFGQLKNSTADKKIKLTGAHFCRVRYCPVCAWRRTLALLARFHQSFPVFCKENPNMLYIYCVLTVKNPPMANLKTTLQHMTKSWARMRHRKAFSFAKGWIRTTEITHGKKDGNPHPHYNLLIAVDKNYFKSRDYLSKDQWVELWKSCARLDYDPSVYVTKVRKKKGMAEGDGSAASAMDAAKEVFKYSVKEDDLISDPEFLIGLTRETRGLRFFAAGGCFADLLGVDEDGDGSEVSEAEMLGQNDDNHEQTTSTRFAFAWEQRQRWDYWFKREFEEPPRPK